MTNISTANVQIFFLMQHRTMSKNNSLGQLVSMTASRRLNAFDRNQQNLWFSISLKLLAIHTGGNDIHAHSTHTHAHIYINFVRSNFWNVCYHWIVPNCYRLNRVFFKSMVMLLFGALQIEPRALSECKIHTFVPICVWYCVAYASPQRHFFPSASSWIFHIRLRIAVQSINVMRCMRIDKEAAADMCVKA